MLLSLVAIMSWELTSQSANWHGEVVPCCCRILGDIGQNPKRPSLIHKALVAGEWNYLYLNTKVCWTGHSVHCCHQFISQCDIGAQYATMWMKSDGLQKVINENEKMISRVSTTTCLTKHMQNILLSYSVTPFHVLSCAMCWHNWSKKQALDEMGLLLNLCLQMRETYERKMRT